MIRFLQTLDEDENPNNGIKITDSVNANAAGKSVDFTSSTFGNTIQDIINDLDDDDTTLVDAVTAQNPFQIYPADHSGILILQMQFRIL